MRHLVTFAVLFISLLYSNETQVFTANSLHLRLDNNAKIEKIFYGTRKEFYEFQKKQYISSSPMKEALMASGDMISSGQRSSLLITGHLSPIPTEFTAAGVLISLAAGAVGAANSDYEYVLKSIVTNTDGKKTILQTIIVSNDSLSQEEGELIAIADQKKLLGSNNER